jgi:hypothetical protein
MVGKDLPPVPLELVEGVAKVWVGLRGGRYRKVSCGPGTLVLWGDAEGEEQGLPDRMYGLADYTKSEFDEAWPPNCRINLPPGVRSPEGRIACETHLMLAASVEEAWSRLKRVGRQGVRKAESLGCQAGHMNDDDYLTLNHSKNMRLGSPKAPQEFVPLLREHVGEENVGITGVWFEGEPIASVLWACVNGYGILIDGASEQHHWSKNPNNLAVWTATKELVLRGAAVVDFGFSPIDSGDALFKKHLGGTCVPLFQLG